MLDVKDLPAEDGNFSIKNELPIGICFCKISKKEVRKRNAKKVFDNGNFLKIQLSE